MHTWYTYIIEKKGKLYVGITTDIEGRMRQHGVKEPLYYEGSMPKADAVKRERKIKGWSRKKNLSLISGDFPKLQPVFIPTP